MELYTKVYILSQTTRQYNFPYYETVQIWFNDAARSAAVRYDDVGDSAAWTGLHLAALAHEYNVTKNSTVLKDIEKSLDALLLLTTCSGKTGYIVRFAGPASDPAYKRYYPGYSNGVFNCTVTPFQDYVWLGHSSRDMYIGVAFGLANVLSMVQASNTELEAIRSETQSITETIVDDLIKYDFWVVSPKAQFINPTPMFIAIWKLLAFTVNPTKYQLLMEAMYILSTFETDSGRRQAVFDKFTLLAVNKSDHFQPGFAAFYLSSFPNTTHFKIPAGILQGGLYDYPLNPLEHHVDQSGNPKYMPHHDEDHSEYALMVRDRPPDSYMWQRSPTNLRGGTSDCCLQDSHLDLTLPYWMGRSSHYVGGGN